MNINIKKIWNNNRIISNTLLFIFIFLYYTPLVFSEISITDNLYVSKKNLSLKENDSKEILIKFKEKPYLYGMAAFKASFYDYHNTKILSSINNLKVDKIVPMDDTLSIDDLIDLLNNDPNVEYAEKNGNLYAQLNANDPSFNNLWGMRNINAPNAWDKSTGSSEVIVAIIDSGVDYTHPDLVDNMWNNIKEVNGTDGVDDDSNGLIDDKYGWDFCNDDNDPMDDNNHGTHTAGTVAAVGNNNVGVVGVSWKTKIMALKFLCADGSGSWAAAARAIDYASKMGAVVSNNSYGGTAGSTTLRNAISQANDRGMLFVVAAGNDGTNNDNIPFFPANYDLPNIISVAAIDVNNNKADFSNFGVTTVHLGAPGVNVFSTIPGSYGSMSGTSMASPHVAGAAALIKAFVPSMTHLEIKDQILDNAVNTPALQNRTITGGRLDIYNSILNVGDFSISVNPALQGTVSGGKVIFPVTINSLLQFSSPVSFSVRFSPEQPGLSGYFSDTIVTPLPDKSKNFSLTVETDSTLQTGSYNIIITGVVGQKTRETAATLQVNIEDFALYLETPIRDVVPGALTTIRINIKSINNFSSEVNLSVPIIKQNSIVSLVPNRTLLKAGLNATSSLTLQTPASIQKEYKFSIQGNGGGKSHTVEGILNIKEGVDLIVTSLLQQNETVSAGSDIMIDVVIKNQGTDSINQSFKTSFYISSDNIIEKNDLFLKELYMDSLTRGTESTFTGIQVSLPGSITSGTYYLGAITDVENAVIEVTEVNNTKTLELEIINKVNIDNGLWLPGDDFYKDAPTGCFISDFL